MRIVSVDPGGTTGFAVFQTNEKLGKVSQRPVEIGEIKSAYFKEWVASLSNVNIWVVEDYIIRPSNKKAGGFDHTWGKGETLRKIGMLEYEAYLTGAEFVLQQPSLKPLAYKQMGAKYVKGKKGTHIYDAIAHGVHYIGKTFG